MYRDAGFYKVGEPLQVEKMPIPNVNGNEVLITVRAASMYHSDVDVTTGYFLYRLALYSDMKSQAK
jgi:NADPH:quinone reductase-like Zn-dependent oxidoreductase